MHTVRNPDLICDICEVLILISDRNFVFYAKPSFSKSSISSKKVFASATKNVDFLYWITRTIQQSRLLCSQQNTDRSLHPKCLQTINELTIHQLNTLHFLCKSKRTQLLTISAIFWKSVPVTKPSDTTMKFSGKSIFIWFFSDIRSTLKGLSFEYW